MYTLDTINAVNDAIVRTMRNTHRPDGSNATAFLEAEFGMCSVVFKLRHHNGRNYWYRDGRREAIKEVREFLCFLVEHKHACLHV